MNDWHLVHLGSFARGGAGLVFTEATAVQDIGTLFRIVMVLTMDKLVPSYTLDVLWEILSLIANSFLIICLISIGSSLFFIPKGRITPYDAGLWKDEQIPQVTNQQLLHLIHKRNYNYMD